MVKTRSNGSSAYDDQSKTKIMKKPKLKTIKLYSKTPKPRPPPKLRRCFREQPSSGNILPNLPLDIQLNIISKLPIKLIVRCKSLSKSFNHHISDLPFTHIYQNNYSSSSNPILINCSTLSSIYEDGDSPNISLDLIEFQQDAYTNYKNPIISKDTIFNSEKVTGGQKLGSSDWFEFGSSIWGYCNGLFCLLNVDLDIFNLFVVNPILGESIKLPDPVVRCKDWSKSMMAYGLGHCQLTDKFKVLRMVTSYLGGTDYENKTEILTIGVDKEWRSVSDINVPYSIRWRGDGTNPQADMVSFCSAIHWIAGPVRINTDIRGNIEPRQGKHIVAFNMTEEKVCALPLPPPILHPYYYGIGVLMDKLCLWERIIFTDDINIWVMDHYGVDGYWTKQFTLKFSRLPTKFIGHLKPLTISVHDGVILISDQRKLVFYDIEANNSLMLIHLVNSNDDDDMSYPMPFVPDFVSFRNRPGWITDV